MRLAVFCGGAGPRVYQTEGLARGGWEISSSCRLESLEGGGFGFSLGLRVNSARSLGAGRLLLANLTRALR